MMITTIFGGITITLLIVLVLMLTLNRTVNERADEKVVPHKLTPFEATKELNPDVAITSIPSEGEQSHEERKRRIEPNLSFPPDVDESDSWPS